MTSPVADVTENQLKVCFPCQCRVITRQQENVHDLAPINHNDKWRSQCSEPMVMSKTCLFCLAVKKTAIA